MDNAILNIIMRAKDEASSVLKDVGSQVDTAKKNVDNMGKAFTVAGGLMTAGGLAGLSMLKDWTAAAAESEAQMAKFDAKLKAAFGSAPETMAKVKTSAEEVSKSFIKLGFDDEMTANAFLGLAAKTKDAAKATDLMSLAADMARSKNIGLADATDQISKILMGKGNRALLEYGIVAKKGGDAADYLAQIQAKVAGQAEAYANTSIGANERLQVTIENLKEELGAKLLPIIAKVATYFLDLIDKLNSINPNLLGTIGVVVGIATAFSLIVGPILTFIGLMSTIGSVVGPIIAAFTGSVLMPALGIIAAVVAVAAIAYLAFKNWGAIMTFLKGVWAGFMTMLGNAGTWFNGLVVSLQQMGVGIMTFFTGVVNSILSFFVGLYTGAVTTFNNIVAAVSSFFAPIINFIVGYLTLLWNFWSYIFTQIFTLVSFVFQGIWALIQIVWFSILDFMTVTLNNLWLTYGFIFLAIYNTTVQVLTFIQTLFTTIWTAIYTFISQTLTNVYMAFMSAWTSISNFVMEVMSVISNFISTKLSEVHATASGILAQVQAAFSSAFNAVKTVVTTIFTSVYDWFTDKLNALWNKVTEMTGKIKDAFQTMADGIMGALRSIKFPHLNISMGEADIGGHKISYPKLDVSWYEKGGWVDNTGLAVVHQGEFVLSKGMLNGSTPIPSTVQNNNQPINIYATMNSSMDINSIGYQLAWVLRNSR